MRRITKAQAAATVGVVFVVIGFALLLVPYRTELTFPRSSSGVLTLADRVPSIECDGPLIDAVQGEPDGWLNYSPNDGVIFEGGSRFSGSWCAPESYVRGAAGSVLFVAGAAVLMVLAFRRRRAARSGVDPGSDEVSSALG